MKRIENSKPFRVCTFVFVLTVLLLLSSTIGTIVAEKPDKPPGKPDNLGPKPPPPPTLYWFYISIGDEGDDLVLESPPTLEVVSTVDSCGWNWPPEKGTRRGGWSADTSSPWNPIPDCLFNVNINAEPYLPMLGINPDIFSITHYWSFQREKGEFDNQPIDFWELNIRWGGFETNPEEHRFLRMHTDYGPELEGDYFPEGEVEEWIVDFNGAIWELYAHDEEGNRYLLIEGTIVTGFDVTIVKGDIVT